MAQINTEKTFKSNNLNLTIISNMFGFRASRIYFDTAKEHGKPSTNLHVLFCALIDSTRYHIEPDP